MKRSIFWVIGMSAIIPIAGHAASIQWKAAQGISCHFTENKAQCIKASWGIELDVLTENQLKDFTVIEDLVQRLRAIRDDQIVVVFRTRWINRGDKAMFVEPGSIWLRIKENQPFRPMTIEEISGLWGDLNFVDSDQGRWVQANVAVSTIYIPGKHYTDKILLFRVPYIGWNRLQIEVDPVWFGTEANRFRLWADRKKKPNS